MVDLLPDVEQPRPREVDDLAVGAYELMVGGIVRGTIDVVDVGAGETEGEIEFDTDPDEPGELLLDFDPRDALIEVRQDATVYLEVWCDRLAAATPA